MSVSDYLQGLVLRKDLLIIGDSVGLFAIEYLYCLEPFLDSLYLLLRKVFNAVNLNTGRFTFKR